MQTNSSSQGEPPVGGEILDPRFPPTSWTLVARARGGDAQGVAARDEFARRYWLPVLGYFRCLAPDRAAAEDLAQGFFEKLTAQPAMFAGANPTSGRFRHYLKRCLANFRKDDLRFHGRQKRAAGEEVHPDGIEGDGWDQLGLVDNETPELAFNRAWAQSLVDDAVARVKTICEEKGQGVHFQLYWRYYLGASPAPPWDELGKAFGLDEKAARCRAETVVRRVRQLIRTRLREENVPEDAIDEELAALRALLL